MLELGNTELTLKTFITIVKSITWILPLHIIIYCSRRKAYKYIHPHFPVKQYFHSEIHSRDKKLKASCAITFEVTKALRITYLYIHSMRI